MKAAYYEVTRGKTCTQINIYSEQEYMEEMARRQAASAHFARYIAIRKARQRRKAQVQETVGTIIFLLGFFVTACLGGGAEEVRYIILFGLLGIGMMLLGGWMGRMFYGQEAKAEWLRRMRERGEIE